MSDEAPPRFEHPMLQGYWTCKNPSCREQELQYLLTQTGGLCWKCFQNQPVVKRANELEVEMAGVVQRVSNRQRGNRAWRHSANVKVRLKAITRALHRLRDRHFEEYMILLQEERIKLGWPPQLAARENVLADGVVTIEKRLRYLRFIPPEDLDADSPYEDPAAS
ncbi:MAG: hypothetical protein KA129_01015 [Microthrixaceae bacterium]|nr:hypothetical protein [Microthrixaceae bacterium]